MTLKDTKSSQEILHEMKTAEREKTQEIEMEGATIKGAMPTFEYLNKPARARDLPPSIGEIFQLPSGQKVVLVPESQLADFVTGRRGPDVKGLDSLAHLNSVHFTRVMNRDAAISQQNNIISDKRHKLSSFSQREPEKRPPTARDVGNLYFDSSLASDSNMQHPALWEQRKRYVFYMDKRDAAWAAGDKEKAKFYKDLMDRNYDNRSQKTQAMRADKYRRQLEAYEQSPAAFAASEESGLGVKPAVSSDGQVLTDEASVGTTMHNISRNKKMVNELPTYNLGQGFHLLLGVGQAYHQDPSSFGTFEMTDDGPVRVDKKEASETTLPIIVYSDPNSGQIERDYRNDSGDRTSYAYSQWFRGLGGTSLYDVSRDEIKSELTPDFTGRDVIDGYKAAKASAKAAPKPAPKVAPPQEIEPAPPPEPRPEPPSSFTGFGMPVVDTLKGRRRAAKRRFPGRQELTDE